MGEHNVGPDDGPKTPPVQVLEEGEHVLQIEAPDAHLLDHGSTLLALAQRPGLVATHVEELPGGEDVDNLIAEVDDEGLRFRGERVVLVGGLGHLAQVRVLGSTQYVLGMAQGLHQGNDLQPLGLAGGREVCGLGVGGSLGALDGWVPGELELVLDFVDEGVEAPSVEPVGHRVQVLPLPHCSLEVDVVGKHPVGHLLPPGYFSFTARATA